MKLYTSILTISACVLLAHAASIPCDKNVDDLSNVDFDDVAVKPESTDQAPIKEGDNNLRKTIADIPVKVVEEPTVLDENSNDYVPKDDDSIVVKRVEIDLSDPGQPQRQEHETQNPENHGELEKALFGIKQSAIDAEKAFNEGFKEVSSSFKTLFGANENLPDVHQKLNNLRHSFSTQIEKLHETIKSNLKSDKVSEQTLKTAESYVENLKKNFETGIDTLTEGVEVLTIIREEDEAIKTKSISEKDGAGKAEGESPSTGSSEANQKPPTAGIGSYLTNFQSGISSLFTNFQNAIQNGFSGQLGGQGGSNPILNFFQGITIPTINQNQKPANGQQDPPAGAQADPIAAASPTPTPAPWGPQAFLQQVQTTWQNIVNPGQNVQQDPPQPAQQPAQQPANNGPITQAIQGIVHFIQRPGQIFTQQPQQQQPQSQQQQQQQPQQPQQQKPQQQQSAPPTPVQGAPSVSVSALPENPQNEVPQIDASPAVPQADSSPVVPAKADAVPPVLQQAQVQAQPTQTGPIQQLVQNNPIVKGIQSAVQRLQGTPNPETPRNDVINEEVKENTKLKGKPGYNGNQGDHSCSGVEEVKEESKEVVGNVKVNEAVLEEIKEEVAKLPSPSDKTE